MHHVMIMHQLAIGITMVYRGGLDDSARDLRFPDLLEQRTPIAMLRTVNAGAGIEVQTCLFAKCTDYEAGSITNVVDMIYTGDESPDPITECWSFEVDTGDPNTNPVIICDGNAYRLSLRGMCIEGAAVLATGAVDDSWGEVSDWSEGTHTQEQIETALAALMVRKS